MQKRPMGSAKRILSAAPVAPCLQAICKFWRQPHRTFRREVPSTGPNVAPRPARRAAGPPHSLTGASPATGAGVDLTFRSERSAGCDWCSGPTVHLRIARQASDGAQQTLSSRAAEGACRCRRQAEESWMPDVEQGLQGSGGRSRRPLTARSRVRGVSTRSRCRASP